MSATMKLLDQGTAEELDGDEVIEAPDFQAMKVKELNAFVEQHEIEIEGWEEMGAAEKRKSLQALVVEDEDGDGVVGGDEDDGGEAAEEAEADPDSVPDDPEDISEEEAAEVASEEKAAADEKAEKAAAKKKAKAKTPAKTSDGEVLPPDPISTTAHEIETIKTEKIAHAMLHDLIDATEFNFFKLGGVLAKCQTEGWEGEYENFQQFVEAETNIKYRKVLYLIQIYNDLVDADVPWESVKSIGWTKLKEISGVVTLENVDAWVKKAASMSTLQLIEEVKAANLPEPEDGEEAESVAQVFTKTFKFHTDQKETVEAAITKAKEASGTDVDSVAIEYVCLDFLSGAGGKAKGKVQSLEELIGSVKGKHDAKEDALQEIFDAFEVHFPEVELTVDLGEA